MTEPPDGVGNGEERQGAAPDLLPGWSSLVILLTIFVSLSGLTLMTILHGDDTSEIQELGGTRAYGPEDFPEIDFDEPLLASVIGATADEAPGTFHVPPPPFSDDEIYPCSNCHEDLEPDTTRRELEFFHADIELSHGSADRWCFDCHNVEDRDRLRLVSGELIAFDESYRLCGQCHGTIYRDWRAGIHGRRRGYWNGAKSYLLCAHCHNPHDPQFALLHPLPPPIRPNFLRAAEADE